MKTLIIGNGGREAALAWKMSETSQLHAFMEHPNPSIIEFSEKSNGRWAVGDILDAEAVINFAREHKIDLVFVNSDAALEAGIVDALQEAGIKTAGPTREGAQIEWDKEFSRVLTQQVCPEQNPKFYVAANAQEAVDVIEGFGQAPFAIKPTGLTGGKGVKVVGTNITKDSALAYAQELYRAGHHAVIFEEKIEGVEFTVQAITDGKTTIFPPATYDYPFRFDEDTGPSTGGMGVYSDVNKNLPFMSKSQFSEITVVMQKVIDALRESGRSFNGVLNGGFFLTKEGDLKVIEFNARFGDPETMNLMSLLEDDCDWVSILEKIADGNLKPDDIKFKPQASALVYLVAPEYATDSTPPLEGHSFYVDTNKAKDYNSRVFFASAAAEEGQDKYKTVGTSRTLAIVSIDDTIEKARSNTMLAIDACVRGELDYRTDIGREDYIAKTKAMLTSSLFIAALEPNPNDPEIK